MHLMVTGFAEPASRVTTCPFAIVVRFAPSVFTYEV
jgi:hypothetical protein